MILLYMKIKFWRDPHLSSASHESRLAVQIYFLELKLLIKLLK
jgi:hypothetical protein